MGVYISYRKIVDTVICYPSFFLTFNKQVLKGLYSKIQHFEVGPFKTSNYIAVDFVGWMSLLYLNFSINTITGFGSDMECRCPLTAPSPQEVQSISLRQSHRSFSLFFSSWEIMAKHQPRAKESKPNKMNILAI